MGGNHAANNRRALARSRGVFFERSREEGAGLESGLIESRCGRGERPVPRFAFRQCVMVVRVTGHER